jgi:hypothetical protein
MVSLAGVDSGGPRSLDLCHAVLLCSMGSCPVDAPPSIPYAEIDVADLK